MLRSSSAALFGTLSILFTMHCSSPTPDAEDDSSAIEEKAFDVKPYAVFGTGNPGQGDNDIDEPDGVIFDGFGNVLMTDAANHRVQVWDAVGKKRLGQFGTADIFKGSIVDLAQDPVTKKLIVSDEDAHVAYMFDPPSSKEKGDLAYTNYKFTGEVWHDLLVDKIGGVTYDSKGRLYSVDAHKNDVRRFTPDGKLDSSWKFASLGSGKYLSGCEGIAVDEKRNTLYVSDEFESTIQAFSLDDGKYLGHMVGASPDPRNAGHPLAGSSVFPAAPEGLWILDDYLLASDEADGGTGHVKIFDLREETVFDTGKEELSAIKKDGKRSGYIGSFGTLLSPDSVTAFTAKDGESYVAVADQGHYQVLIYKWSEIVKAGKFERAEK